MAAMFPLPAAGCPTAPMTGRCARCTDRRHPTDVLYGYPHRGAEPAHRAFSQRDVTAMRSRDIAGDGKAQAGAAFILVAGVVQPQERLEHFLAHIGRNARTVVVD